MKKLLLTIALLSVANSLLGLRLDYVALDTIKDDSKVTRKDEDLVRTITIKGLKKNKSGIMKILMKANPKTKEVKNITIFLKEGKFKLLRKYNLKPENTTEELIARIWELDEKQK